MYKYISYIWLVMGVLFLQIFLLDNISLTLWLRPMIFPIIVLLLPMEWRTIWVLLAALVVGVIMDISLGGAGLYTASLLPLAILRRTTLYITTHRAVEQGDQKELLPRLGNVQMMLYLSAMMLIYHTLFFVLDTLSMVSPLLLIVTIIASTILSMLLAWPIVRLFVSKVVTK